MRRVMTRVLPEPAPARISSEPLSWSTASRCSGFRSSRIVDKGDTLAARLGFPPEEGRAAVAFLVAERLERRERAPQLARSVAEGGTLRGMALEEPGDGEEAAGRERRLEVGEPRPREVVGDDDERVAPPREREVVEVGGDQRGGEAAIGEPPRRARQADGRDVDPFGAEAGGRERLEVAAGAASEIEGGRARRPGRARGRDRLEHEGIRLAVVRPLGVLAVPAEAVVAHGGILAEPRFVDFGGDETPGTARDTGRSIRNMPISLAPRIAFVLLLAPVVRGQLAGKTDLQPRTYISASGRVTAHVDPSERSGAGRARYEVRRDGVVAWAGDRPFTLRQAAVAEDGTVAGYGYSNGYEGAAADGGNFIVAILAPDGTLRARESVPRHGSRFLHTESDPKSYGVFLDESNDRFVVRVEDPDVNVGAESWWTYRLSTGESLGKPKPKERLSDSQGDAGRSREARPIPGTPLTLLQWWRTELSRDGLLVSARFTLLDLACVPVWSLDLPGDYTVRGNDDASDKLQDELPARSAILDTSLRHFTLRHVAANRRVTYEVERDSSMPSGWRVVEQANVAFVDERKAESRPSVASRFREMTLSKIGSIELRSPSAIAAESAIQRVGAFAMDDRGRFGFVSHQATPDGVCASLVVVDGGGKLVRRTELPSPVPQQATSRCTAWIAGDRWVVTTSPLGIETQSSASWVDVASGTVEPIQAFACPQIESIDSTRDGGFVALTRARSRYTSAAAVHAFDAHGRLQWSVGEQFEDPKKLFSPQDVAVTADGHVVVLEHASETLKVYDRRGEHAWTVDLTEAWGRKPNYLSKLASDGDGVVVFDFKGKPSVVRMTLGGEIVAQVSPRFADGTAFNVTGRVQSDSEGRLWTSDGHALLRLDAGGAVDRVLGRGPDLAVLGDVAQLAVGFDRRIYAADTRTGAVHVFDETGATLHVCRPAPSDYPGRLFLPSMTISDTGAVFIARTANKFPRRPDFLRYGRDGTREGVESVPLEEVAQAWLCQAKTRNRWVLGFTRAYLVDAKGTTLRVLDRGADGRWLQHPGLAGTARDGSIAIVSSADPVTVNLFTSNADPIATWPAPMSFSGPIAYDGKRIVYGTSAPGPTPTIPIRMIVACSTDGTPEFRFELPPGNQTWRPYLVPSGPDSELWLFDGVRTIHRYALP